MSKKFIGTHWGTYTHGNKKSKPKLGYWTKDLNPTKFGLDFINAAQDNLRISQPYIRKGWLEKNKTLRGRDTFIPVSWDKAIRYASTELTKVKKNTEMSVFMLAHMDGQVQVDFIMLKAS